MALLPVSGFVLAGGLSLRMGTDKALLPFLGRPMVEIAVETLLSFCADVSIVGNRDDLKRFAPVVDEMRIEAGPAAGVEAGLSSAAETWAMFMPVDVPLVPAELLRQWIEAVTARGCVASYLLVHGQKQPTFCALRRDCLPTVSATLHEGERRLAEILRRVAAAGAGELWCCEAADLAFGKLIDPADLESHFCNVNTPEDKVRAERGRGAGG